MLIDGLVFSEHGVLCEHGHESHKTVVVPVNLVGARSHDFASIPESLRLEFELEGFYYPFYADIGPGFCPARGCSSEGILSQQTWEPYETRLILGVLQREPGLVLDFGANIGWYSLLAALNGHNVIAFECDPETCDVLRRNAARNGVADRINVVTAWVNDKLPRFHADADVLLVKIDVEGEEANAVQACWDLFEQRRIKYALVEISPTFGPGYGELIESIIDVGYSAFAVPDKHSSHRDEFNEDPLGALERTRIFTPHCYVASIEQGNVFFTRDL